MITLPPESPIIGMQAGGKNPIHIADSQLRESLNHWPSRQHFGIALLMTYDFAGGLIGAISEVVWKAAG